MFSFAQIAFSGVVGVIASAIALLVHQRLAKRDPLGEMRAPWPLAVVVGLSIIAWRMAGNTPALNEDPIAFVSPNDVLCPVITYVSIGVYAALSGSNGTSGWPRAQALLTIVSLVVNVVTI